MTFEARPQVFWPKGEGGWGAAPLILIMCSFFLSGGIQVGVALLRFGLPELPVVEQFDGEFGKRFLEQMESGNADERVALLIAAIAGAGMYLSALIWLLVRVFFARHYLADVVVLALALVLGVWGVVSANAPPVSYGVV